MTSVLLGTSVFLKDGCKQRIKCVRSSLWTSADDFAAAFASSSSPSGARYLTKVLRHPAAKGWQGEGRAGPLPRI